jgi:membrane protein required for colicin V production
MWIDVVLVLVLVLSGWHGFRKGFIMSLFSCAALFIGLAAALKCSSMVAGMLAERMDKPPGWLPVLVFVALFLLVSALVRQIGNLLDKTAEDVMLGPLNRLAGFTVYALLYIMIYSILLYYADRMGWISPEVRSASSTFVQISTWGPSAIKAFGRLIPLMGNVIQDLQRFFEGLHAPGSLKG